VVQTEGPNLDKIEYQQYTVRGLLKLICTNMSLPLEK
jgi:hypothetical protein